MPAATGGVVGPKPVPQRISTSPGLAATVVAPGESAVLHRQTAIRIARGHCLTAGPEEEGRSLRRHGGRDSDAGAAGSRDGDGHGPVPTSGACTLICPGLMK